MSIIWPHPAFFSPSHLDIYHNIRSPHRLNRTKSDHTTKTPFPMVYYKKIAQNRIDGFWASE